jgi:membrane-associated phospholipid phosphatase
VIAEPDPTREPALDGPAVESVDPEQPLADAARDSAALRRSRRRSVAVSVVLVAIAATLTVMMLVDPRHPWVQPFDDWWYRWIAAHRTPWLTHVADVLAVVGSSAVTIPVRLAVAALLALRRRWTQLLAFAAAILVSELLIGPLKSVVDRPRPPHPLIATSAASFPSGHAIAAAVTAFGIVVAFLPRGRRRLVWIGIASFVAASMAWSRTYLAAHWSTDTIAGVCIGVAAALLCEAAFESTRTAVAEQLPTVGDPTADDAGESASPAAAPVATTGRSPRTAAHSAATHVEETTTGTGISNGSHLG